ncbi:MAG: hypothetical protein PHE73_04620 [Sulfurovaceae bacterium]|nr:hypothetical protein [Sulfurovaceae bacterium]
MLIKKDSTKSPFNNIVIVDPYSGRFSIIQNGMIDPVAKPTFLATQFASSYLSNKDMIVSQLYISRRVPDEDLRGAIEIKAQEELGVSENDEEYIVDFLEAESNSEERLFHVFVVKANQLFTLFNTVKNGLKYIDLILPAPLLYNVLYTQKILQPNGVHIFIYFMDNDAFIAIYKNGSFAYSKALDYSLERMLERYSEITSQHIDKHTFLNILKNSATKTSDISSKEVLTKIFEELFIIINDVIIYVKRALKVESIDEIYIGSDIGEIYNINEYSLTYLGQKSLDFNFKYGIGTNTKYNATGLELLLAKTSIDYIENNTSMPNLTQFQRPPSFKKRPGGRFIISIAVATVLGLIYPLFYLLSSYINNIQTYRYISQSEDLSTQVAHYKQVIAEKKLEISSLGTEEKKEAALYSAKESTLKTIYDKKVNYRMKSQTFYNLTNDLKKYGVYVDELQNQDNNFSLSLVNKEDRKITELIKYLSEKYYNDIVKINIELIEKDQNSAYYKGVLRMELK